MKKIIGILSIVLIFVSLISCNKPTPSKFNDELMSILNSADSEYNSFYSHIEQFSYNDKKTAISQKIKVSIEQMEKKKEKINGLKVPKGGEELKNTCLDYVNIMINSMKEFISEKELSKSQYDRAVKNMENNEEKLNNVNEKIIDEQENFAEKKGFEFKEIPQKK